MDFLSKICPGVLHLGCCNILIAISALFTANRRIQKSKGFNKHAGEVVSNKAVQGDKSFPKIIDAHAHLLET